MICVQLVSPWIERHLPGLDAREPALTETCTYTMTHDHDYVLDFAPGDGRVVVVSACSGHGFKLGPLVGEIAADLALRGGTDRADMRHFRAQRVAL